MCLFISTIIVQGFSKTRGFIIVILTGKVYLQQKMAPNHNLKSNLVNILSNFVIFFVNWTEKIVFNPKKFKNINPQKWCQNGSRPLVKALGAIKGFSKTRGFTSVILTQWYLFENKSKFRA